MMGPRSFSEISRDTNSRVYTASPVGLPVSYARVALIANVPLFSMNIVPSLLSGCRNCAACPIDFNSYNSSQGALTGSCQECVRHGGNLANVALMQHWPGVCYRLSSRHDVSHVDGPRCRRMASRYASAVSSATRDQLYRRAIISDCP